MSTRQEETTPLIRFCDAFFQERNIKWLLGIGALILLGSSTMLVTSHWDSYTPLWKYAVFLGYTGLIHVAGQIGYHRLALRKTGTGLMALTVMLIPLVFAAFRWVHPASILSIDGLLAQSGLLVLLAINSVFSCLAARRIFQHFLRKDEYRFLTSYLVLSAGGAIVPAIPATAATLVAGVCWLAYIVGATSVSRHAFWLAEEHRQPRIFGFFPVILLGGQFITLFALALAPHIPIEWIGCGVVLTAIPLLLASDALAAVLRLRRHGDTEKLAASVVVSMILGVAVVLGGVFISGYGYPGTFALVPTTALAAVVMGLIGRRTQKQEFVWMMLLMVTVAYQTSPVFFRELTKSALQHGAAAVGESRMPLAFYGITYLPLLALTTLASLVAYKFRWETFARPLRLFSVGVPLLLLPLAMTHTKAMLPVGLAMTTLLVGQTVLFRRSHLQFAAFAAFLVSSFGLGPFLHEVLNFTMTADLLLISWVISGGVLLFPGIVFDRFLQKLSPADDSKRRPYFAQCISVIMLLGCALFWIVSVPTAHLGPVSGITCFGLLVIHCFRFRNTFVSSVTLTLPIFLTLVLSQQAMWSFAAQVTLSVLVLAGLSVTSLALQRRPEFLLTQVFGSASAVVSLIGLIVLQAIFIPMLLFSAIGLATFSLWWPAVITCLASSELAWRKRSSALIVLNWLGLLSLVAAATPIVAVTGSILDSILISMAGVSTLLAIVLRLTTSKFNPGDVSPEQRCLTTLEWCVGTTLGFIAIITLPCLSGSMRVAGMISLCGSFILVVRKRFDLLADMLMVLVNGHLIALTVQLVHPGLEFLLDIDAKELSFAAIPLALTTSLSAIFWERRRVKSTEVAAVSSFSLQVFSVTAILLSIANVSQPLALPQIAIAILALLALTSIQCLAAIRNGQVELTESDEQSLTHAEVHAWSAIALAAAIPAYNLIATGTTLSSSIILFVPLAVFIVTWGASRLCRNGKAVRVFTRPLSQTSTFLPSLTVLFGLLQAVSGSDIIWPGMNSLALLLAGGFYFAKGLEKRRTDLLVTAAAVLNIALALLWNDLHWTDPQLFMIPIGITILTLVQCLKEQIPVSWRDPLRYVGALTILVSPTFEIVGGSWLHLLTLMVSSVLIVLFAMGLQVRALMYTGTAFLVADLIAIVVRGSIDHPSLLWLSGIAVGLAVIGLAAYCERNREKMLQNLRFLAARLEAWD